MKKAVVPLITAAVIAALDQAVKYFVDRAVINDTALLTPRPLIKGIIEFCYLHNDGAGMGLFSGGRWYLIAITGLVLLGIVAYMLLGKSSEKSRLLVWALSLIVGGGAGNLIDRIRFGYVIDFIRFPVSWFNYSFNIADCAVVVGGIMLALWLILDIFKSGAEKTHSDLQDNSNGLS